MKRNEALNLIRRSDLAAHVNLLAESLLPSARIHVHQDTISDHASISRFGGLPCLPNGVHWPVWDKHDYLKAEVARLEKQFSENPRATGLRDMAVQMRKEMDRDPVPLLFLGQIALKEIFDEAPIPGWPRGGTLSFFLDQSHWGFDPLARGFSRVLYFPDDTELVPQSWPKAFPSDAMLRGRRISFEREWTLPTRICENGIDLSAQGDDAYGDLCRQLEGKLGNDTAIHRCGGHPQEIQGEMRLECQLVTHGLYCGDATGYEDPRRTVLEKNASDWQLLLQIDSDETQIGWMWGDMGRVYFWTRQQDIGAAKFEDSWAILQCY